MQLIHLFIRDFRNFILFINGVFQMFSLFYHCIFVNGSRIIIAIKSGIISNWQYYIICGLMIIIRMYSDKCREMYNYEKQKEEYYEKKNDMKMFYIYKLKHNIHQVKLNAELKFKLLKYKHDSALYKLYDIMLDKNYILNHKYNQLIINKHIEKYSNNLFNSPPPPAVPHSNN
jgi:predicted nucleic acid-binding Zn ribbon protein